MDWTSDFELLEIHALFHRMGISPHLKGYWYLAWILWQVKIGALPLGMITKNLYSATAEQFGTTCYAVERDLRTVISWTWEQGDQAYLETVFGQQYKPTKNGEFLSKLALYLSVESSYNKAA